MDENARYIAILEIAHDYWETAQNEMYRDFGKCAKNGRDCNRGRDIPRGEIYRENREVAEIYREIGGH